MGALINILSTGILHRGIQSSHGVTLICIRRPVVNGQTYHDAHTKVNADPSNTRELKLQTIAF